MTPLPLNERATTRAVQGGIIKMLHIAAEREHYCLLTDGTAWTIAERRAGKSYPLGDCRQVGVSLDQPDADRLLREGRQYSERAARRILTDVAADWRHLFEVIR